MKKIMSAIFALALVLAPVESVVFKDHAPIVEAKGYKSGKKSFNTNKTPQTNNFQKQNPTTTNKATTTPNKGGFMGGGLMKGLMLGGLAGLLFGSLFAGMGVLGSILGFLINIIAIVALIVIIRKIYVYFKEKNKKEDPNPWKS